MEASRLREGVSPVGGEGGQCPRVTGSSRVPSGVQSALCPLCGLSLRPPAALGRESVFSHVSCGSLGSDSRSLHMHFSMLPAQPGRVFRALV